VKKLITLVAAAIVLIGCSSSTPEPAATAPAAASGASSASGAVAAIKQYPMHGKVVKINPDKSIKIDAGPIGDLMGAMTMDYAVKDDADRAKLTPGTTFDATYFVQGDDDWVGEVKPVK
jgi:Cu/Ag efflux protein CusF